MRWTCRQQRCPLGVAPNTRTIGTLASGSGAPPGLFTTLLWVTSTSPLGLPE